MCDCNGIRDEFHFILKCTHFANRRIGGLRDTIIRFNEQMNTYAVEKPKALSKFIKKILISFGYFNFIYS